MLSIYLRFGWPPWWVDNAGHNDIEIKFRRDYLNKLKMFIEAVFELIKLPDEELDLRFKPFDRHIPIEELPEIN